MTRGRPKRPNVGALSRSLHGRAITVTVASPTVVAVHDVPERPEAWRPPVRHKVHLEIGNSTAGALNAEVHYNNGSTEVAVPAHGNASLDITCEGSSPRCFVASPTVAVSLINGQSGTLTVAGGFEEL